MRAGGLRPGWPGRVAVAVPLGVYCFVYPIGLVLLVAGWLPPEAGWVGGVLLTAQAVALVAAWGVAAGAARALGAGLVLAGAGWALEAAGVTAGVPFGAYHYTGALGPALGPVPWAIPAAWVGVVGAAWGTARRGLGRWGSGAVVLGGAVLATALDAVIETTATRVQGYWLWDAGPTAYYGVPAANFAAWCGAALVLGLLLSVLLPAGARPGWHGRIAPLLYVLNVVMFGVIDWSRGYLVPAALAGVLLGILVWRRV